MTIVPLGICKHCSENFDQCHKNSRRGAGRQDSIKVRLRESLVYTVPSPTPVPYTYKVGELHIQKGVIPES